VEEEDEIWVTPDSPEWFDWLDGLSSFFFDGKDGDFTATARMETLRRRQGWRLYGVQKGLEQARRTSPLDCLPTMGK